MSNSLREPYTLFEIVDPGSLGEKAAFKAEFTQPIAAGCYREASPQAQADATKAINYKAQYLLCLAMKDEMILQNKKHERLQKIFN